MAYIKERTITNVDLRAMTNFIVLSGLAMAFPFFIHLQWLSGPMVNAILVLALFLVGIRSALLLCMIPSMMALAGGLLPALMAPVLPFIMLSNALYVIAIDYFHQRSISDTKGFFSGLLIGSSLKFLLLFFSVELVSGLLIKQDLAVKVAQMFSYTQFFTAFSGGMIAYVILRAIKRF